MTLLAAYAIKLLMLAAIASFIVEREQQRKVAPGGWQKPDRRVIELVMRKL
jgi:hypothetical protein